jgi:AraC-like DNA-binding protein
MKTMEYRSYSPRPSLSAYVRNFWTLEGTASPTQPFVYRTMADGCAELIFHYEGLFDDFEQDTWSASFRSGIHGPAGASRLFRVQTSFRILGAYLYPFTIMALTGMPAIELCDELPDAESLWGSGGRLLEECIAEATGIEEQINLASEFLESKLSAAKGPDRRLTQLVSSIIHHPGSYSVPTLATDAGMSVRHLERQFARYVGFSPKRFMRINRFQQVLKLYPGPNRNLVDIAYECGYYDQAHFIHDFKKFAGIHPSSYFKHNTDTADLRSIL